MPEKGKCSVKNSLCLPEISGIIKNGWGSTPRKEHGMKNFLCLIGGLPFSNLFMTFAWYAHLKHLNHKPWIIAALISWGVAFFEYLIQVPANRAGYNIFSLEQLKIIQEIITLSVFIPFAILYMKEKISFNYLWAGLCLLGAAFFIFKK